MTIRRILLIAFLLVSLLPAAALTVLAFNRTHAAMLGEIEQGVMRSASAVSADVDKLLFERLLNATTWNHLEVMQDLRLDDVDKRLSNFLGEMKRRYGDTYLDLHGLDRSGRIVASSDPARLGAVYPPPRPWQSARLPGGELRIERPLARSGDRAPMLLIRVSIPSEFTEGDVGELALEFNWQLVQRILDRAANLQRQLLLLDAPGKAIAASAGLQQRGRALLSGWLPDSAADAAYVRDGQPLMDALVIVGHARSQRFEPFAGFGWTTLLLQSRAVALAPVHRMAWTFAGLLAITALVTIAVSLAIAGAIARPIVALTDFTRRYAQPGELPPPPRAGPGEVGELTRSFTRLVRDLEHSQQTLTQASKLAAVGEVTALLAHEVRTPLGILRSSAQTLRDEPGLSAEGNELLQIIDSETGRLNRLVSSLLDSARARAPQRTSTDLHALIRHAASLLATQCRDRRIRLELELQAQHSQVDVDGEQLTQVLLNLAMNALQILAPGGRIRVSSLDEPERLVVVVDDDGPGIAAEDHGRIFEPFVFKREGGLGLGLAVVRQILRQHGGDIVASASPLGGAAFRFWLPRGTRIP
ncbi:MAG TPA: ATP-binding protein [Solimonas sp.]|nr:ATP-binding protein [Solimonas sp.]